jgi:predicted RNA-binding Zn-ribbon protein involved in translation (DUF1610 family)
MIIKLHCVCGQPIEVETEHHGLSFNCPSCGKDLVVPDYRPPSKAETQKLPPPIAISTPVAERMKIKEKQSHAGPICLFIFGVLLLPFFWIGLILIVVAIIIDILLPSYKSITYVCGQCGNSVSSVSQICPTCHIKLIDSRPWWW